MEPFYDTYEDPGNNSIMITHVENDYTCASCHDKAKIDGKIHSLSLALPEAYLYYTGQYDEDDLGGHVTPEYCLKCHDTGVGPKPGEVESAIAGKFVDPHGDDANCVDCHSPHQIGIGLTEEACTVCHGTNYDDFGDKLDLHASTTATVDDDCMACHNKLHDRNNPDQMRISFSDPIVEGLIVDQFCGDCHDSQIQGFSTWSTEKKEIYDDCSSVCHQEHNIIPNLLPHNNSQEIYTGNCDKCHSEGVESHKFYNVSYSSFASEIQNVYCQNCHKNEYKLVADNNVGTCTDCHAEHETKPVPVHVTYSPYDDCSTCHFEMTTKHNPSSVSFTNFPDSSKPNDFCQACHKDEYDRLENNFHNARDCLDCHGEHKVMRVNFDDCKVCHQDKIPGSHTLEYNRECSQCHDTTKIHEAA
jgi:hypothetical protein